MKEIVENGETILVFYSAVEAKWYFHKRYIETTFSGYLHDMEICGRLEKGEPREWDQLSSCYRICTPAEALEYKIEDMKEMYKREGISDNAIKSQEGFMREQFKERQREAAYIEKLKKQKGGGLK